MSDTVGKRDGMEDDSQHAMSAVSAHMERYGPTIIDLEMHFRS